MRGKCNFSVDSAFTIKSWNSDIEKLGRKQAENIIGEKVNDVFPRLQDKIELVFGDGRKRHIKASRHICLIGSNISYDVRLCPVKDGNGKVKEVSVVLDNISGRCPLSRHLSDSDEQMIAIGKMASSLAHGVRNPLNAIKGAVVYLSEKYGHEKTLLEFSTIINDEINRLDNFVSNFLSAARGELRFAPINPNDILKTIIAMIKPRSEIQNIAISHDLSDLPLVSADAFQIEQALFNIINNAIEAMPKGGSIDIKTSSGWEKDIDYAVIEISDTGKGIPGRKLNKLGELSNKPERNERGFGIFLSREIIKAHNGKLLWESVRGKGTIFKIFLPVNPLEAVVRKEK
ncbi:MAG: hypothetical protein HZB61_02145 [Nitrospirae bacterium]|nr:hypothetical protein [Nitrospirota bacterium]